MEDQLIYYSLYKNDWSATNQGKSSIFKRLRGITYAFMSIKAQLIKKYNCSSKKCL